EVGVPFGRPGARALADRLYGRAGHPRRDVDGEDHRLHLTLLTVGAAGSRPGLHVAGEGVDELVLALAGWHAQASNHHGLAQAFHANDCGLLRVLTLAGWRLRIGNGQGPRSRPIAGRVEPLEVGYAVSLDTNPDVARRAGEELDTHALEHDGLVLLPGA